MEQGDENTNSYKKRQSIRSKMIISIVISMMIVMPIIGGVFNVVVSKNFRDMQEQILQKETLNLSGKSEQFFNKYIDIMEQAAKDKTVKDFILRTESRNDMNTVEGIGEIFGLMKDIG